MFNFILIFISVVAVATIAIGSVILFRPAKQADSPVKAPADVITVVSVDNKAPQKEPEELPIAPLSTLECQLELMDMHKGDIIVSTEASPETVEAIPNPSHDLPQEASAPEEETPRPQEPTDVVSKSITEEQEEAPGTSPYPPLELFEDVTY